VEPNHRELAAPLSRKISRQLDIPRTRAALKSMNSQQIVPTPEVRTGLLRAAPISTNRLILREFQLADCRDLFEIHGDARTTRYAGGTRTREQSFESLCRMISRLRETGFGTLALQLKSGKGVIGWAGIQPLLGTDRYEILYALKPAYWGYGFATEAGAALLEVVFDSMNGTLDELYALVFPQNIASIRVLEKLGFVFLEYYFDEPTKRNACLFSISRSSFPSEARGRTSIY